MTSMHDELRSLADRLTGAGWERKFPSDWTTAEHAAHVEDLAARGIDPLDWLNGIFDLPYETETLDHWHCGRYSFIREHSRAGLMESVKVRCVSGPWSDPTFPFDPGLHPRDHAPYERACTPEELEEVKDQMASSYWEEIRARTHDLEAARAQG
jgi:hypothetical protein